MARRYLGVEKAYNLVRQCLSDDLRKPMYRGHPNKYWGHCYVASEALYHLISNKHGFKPHWLSYCDHETLLLDTHWYLMTPGSCHVLDPTFDQFPDDIQVDWYTAGKCCGFLTRKPSKRAQILMAKVRKALNDPGA